MTSPADLSQFFGQDFTLTQSGDLATVQDLDRAKQHIIRRLMTNPGDYIFHPKYGGGIGSFVGSNIDISEVRAVIISQMALENSVSQNPAPVVAVTTIDAGFAVSIAFTTAQSNTPTVLSFNVQE